MTVSSAARRRSPARFLGHATATREVVILRDHDVWILCRGEFEGRRICQYCIQPGAGQCGDRLPRVLKLGRLSAADRSPRILVVVGDVGGELIRADQHANSFAAQGSWVRRGWPFAITIAFPTCM